MSVDLSVLKKNMYIEIKGRGIFKVICISSPFLGCNNIFWVDFIENNRIVTGEYKKDGTAGGYTESKLIAKNGNIIAIK